MIEVHQYNLSKNQCGVGFPDFYANQMIGDHPACFIEEVDWLLSPLFQHLKFCQAFEDFGYQLDANGDPTIGDCRSE